MAPNSVRNIVTVIIGLSYLFFLRWMKQETTRFNNALLNRLSDIQAATFPDVKLPGTEDYESDDDPSEYDTDESYENMVGRPGHTADDQNGIRIKGLVDE